MFGVCRSEIILGTTEGSTRTGLTSSVRSFRPYSEASHDGSSPNYLDRPVGQMVLTQDELARSSIRAQIGKRWARLSPGSHQLVDIEQNSKRANVQRKGASSPHKKMCDATCVAYKAAQRVSIEQCSVAELVWMREPEDAVHSLSSLLCTLCFEGQCQCMESKELSEELVLAAACGAIVLLFCPREDMAVAVLGKLVDIISCSELELARRCRAASLMLVSNENFDIELYPEVLAPGLELFFCTILRRGLADCLPLSALVFCWDLVLHYHDMNTAESSAVVTASSIEGDDDCTDEDIDVVKDKNLGCGLVIAAATIAAACREMALCAHDALAVLYEFSRDLDARDLAHHLDFSGVPYIQYDFKLIEAPAQPEDTLTILRSLNFSSRANCLKQVRARNGDTTAVAALWDLFQNDLTLVAELLWAPLPLALRLRIFFLTYATLKDADSSSLSADSADLAFALLDKCRGKEALPTTLISKRRLLLGESIDLNRLVEAALSDLELVATLSDSKNYTNGSIDQNHTVMIPNLALPPPCVVPPPRRTSNEDIDTSRPAAGCLFCAAQQPAKKKSTGTLITTNEATTTRRPVNKQRTSCILQ